MRRKIISCILLVIMPGYYLKTFSQVRISGPVCVVPGTEYQYNLFSSVTSQIDSINFCVHGGQLTTSHDSCYSGKYVSSIRITWNDNITKGNISFSTLRGNQTFEVKTTKPLQGGKIDSLSLLQVILSSKIPSVINCKSAKGGSCLASYQYQWEESEDNLHWTELKNADSKNLYFSELLNQTSFFRRKTFESTSNSIAYSDVAIVVVTNP